MKVSHEFGPYINKDSKVLILGSIPSVKSRELGFYYMHPQNRFWKLMSDLLKEKITDTIGDKKDFLYTRNLLCKMKNYKIYKILLKKTAIRSVKN